ncbi:platelet-activating factor acetylhydrolase IB subunit gamma [Folsomia candida]|uniref:Platelet-activating factor acetylhydrolase IB subunit gamma n=1 Tax=Folsomia candida TaxID=158441 RepID=A0A226DR94_FOLCA|nr:platelet-activating factor acetylhydrolase IB subunit gamma [Folsomia candida]OXA47528.1 Platelet-activating factor acetylhydrolase IB subunit gamma [Folsomia candida]
MKLLFATLLLCGFALASPAPKQDRCTNAVFLGDSITDAFDNGNGAPVWQQFYAPIGAINTGVGGDRTTTIIDRINNQGIIDGLGAHVAVLKIGTNDLSGGVPETTVAQNIGQILNLIKDKNRGVKILLLGILPRNGVDIHNRIRNVNAIIRGYADNLSVFYLDMEAQFQGDAIGTVPTDLFYDGLHLTLRGYEVWAETMNTQFFNLVNNPICP